MALTPRFGEVVSVSLASSSRADGRLCGSLARAAATCGRIRSGTALISGSVFRIRNMIASGAPAPNGERPLAAYAIHSAQQKTSAAVPACPMTCSGAMNPAEPTVIPATVSEVASKVCAMPKSMTFGPLLVSSTLEGLRSRCTMPIPWIAVSASASPVARPNSMSPDSGPKVATYSESVGPSAYSVTRNGCLDSVSASTTRTVHTPMTRVRADTSRVNLVRNSGSSASSGRRSLTATGVPSSAVPRYTTPMPPAPSRAVRR